MTKELQIFEVRNCVVQKKGNSTLEKNKGVINYKGTFIPEGTNEYWDIVASSYEEAVKISKDWYYLFSTIELL